MAGSEPSALGRPQGLIIRQYRKADREALAALFYQIQQEEFPWVDGDTLSLQDFERATEGERIFVAELDGVPAGFCSVWEPDSFVHNLFVAKGCRRAGVGSALLGAVEELARRCGCKRLWLVTTNDNTHALAFYQRRGFVLAALHRDAVTEARRVLKPTIPLVGEGDLPIRDELELEKRL